MLSGVADRARENIPDTERVNFVPMFADVFVTFRSFLERRRRGKNPKSNIFNGLMVVEAVLSEPVSAEFPVKQGKNREFFQNQAVLGRIGCSNELLSHVFLLEFPKHRNREFFSAEQGI